MTMKFVLALTLATVWATDVPGSLKNYNSYINADIVKAIKDAGAEWEAYNPDENPLRIYSEQELRGMMSLTEASAKERLLDLARNEVKLEAEKSTKAFIPFLPKEPVKSFNLPSDFNWSASTYGENCAPIVVSQGRCGSCYAFATATAFSARRCQAEYVAKGTANFFNYNA